MKKQAQYFPTPYGRTPKNINNINIALNNLMQKSQTLNILKLENLSLTLDDAGQLAHVSFCISLIITSIITIIIILMTKPFFEILFLFKLK